MKIITCKRYVVRNLTDKKFVTDNKDSSDVKKAILWSSLRSAKDFCEPELEQVIPVEVTIKMLEK